MLDPKNLGDWMARAARMLVGIPDYESYVAQHKTTHPGEPVMTYEEFFRERQEARYGGADGRPGRCC